MSAPFGARCRQCKTCACSVEGKRRTKQARFNHSPEVTKHYQLLDRLRQLYEGASNDHIQ